MKRMVLLLALAIALPAAAQAPEKKPAAKEPAKKTASTKRQEDARHCLEKGSNTEIIKCAEAYL